MGSRVQKLEQLIRWDGRLNVDDRRKSFESICRVAKESHQIAQLNALESLAKIVHGVGLKDLPRLNSAGYSKADLLETLYAKTTAFKELEDFVKNLRSNLESKINFYIPSNLCYLFTMVVGFIYFILETTITILHF